MKTILSVLCIALAGAVHAQVPLRNPRISGDSAAVASGTLTVQSGATLDVASGGTISTAAGAVIELGDPLALGNGGTGAALTDPGADRVMFWDESLGAVTWLTVGDGLTLTGTTLSAAEGFANPMEATGDLIVGGTAGAPERLAIGTAGHVLTVVDGAPAWAASTAEGGAPNDATYIVQTASGELTNEQALGALSTGLLKNTTTTGVLSIATAGTDYVAPVGITGSGLGMNTARILGRTTASAGAVEEITVGAGLTLSAGELSATGGGGGGGGTLSLARYDALDNQPPATAFATFDTRNSIAVLDFDAATAEGAVFVGIVPEGADFTTGIRVRVVWMATTATSGAVVWETAFERSTTDLDADSWGTAKTATATASGTAGIAVTTAVDHSGSEIDGLEAGDLFRVRVRRLGADGADTMSGDAELIAVEVRQL